MAKSTTGGKGLSYSAKLNVAEAIAAARLLKKEIAGISGVTTGSSKGAFDTKPLTGYQQAQIALKKTLLEAQVASQKLRNDTLELNKSFVQGKISAQQLSAAERQNTKDRRALAEATKQARQAQVAASGSYDEAVAKLRTLGRSIKAAEGGFNSTNPAIRAQIREYNTLNDALKKFDSRLGNHQRNVGNYGIAVNGLVNALKSMALTYLSVYGAIQLVSKAININAEISDGMSDVRRTAQLTNEEVSALVETLKSVNTRTSLKGLLDIAVIGGQLGIAKDQLAGFTVAIDQLAVTLSGEIKGGAQEVASSLGKINGVFKVQQKEGTDVEKSFNKTGSAILALGQAGLATGEFLQDFTLRVAGVAQAANISLPTVLAYAAVLEESGSSAEVAGTSMNRLIGSLATKRSKFFAIAQLQDSTLTLEKFTKIINTDANEALQLFFKGLNSGNPNLTTFNDRLDTIGIKAGPSKNAIIALAQNQDLLNTRVNESVTAYNEGTLASEQFKVKNDNLAGSVAKLGKEFDNVLQGDGIGKFFKTIIDGATHALVEINKLFTAKSVSDFFGRGLSFDTRIWDRKENIASNFNDSSSFLKSNNLNPIGASDSAIVSSLATSSLKDLEKLRQGFIKATEQAATAVNLYKKGIAKGDLSDGGAIRAKQAQDNYDKLQKSLYLVSDAYKKAKASKKDFGSLKNEETDSDTGRTVDDIKADIKRVTELKAPLDVASDQYKKYVEQLKAFKKELKLANGGVDTEGNREASQYKTALNSRNDLQARISELTKKGTDKQLTADDQEVESVKDKYAKMLEAAKKFNNDPENKKRGLRVDGSGLSRAQDRELVAVNDKQQAEKLKITLDTQKKMYDEYEAYKSKVGEEEANKRYGQELNNYATYLEALNAKRDALLNNDQKSKGGSEADTAAVQLQLKLVDEEIAAEVIANKKKNDEIYADAYQAALTNSQALLGIEADYQRQVLALGKGATKEQIDNLKRLRDARVRSENEANAYAKGGFDDLMANYDAMTRGAILKRLEAIKDGYAKEYKEGKITAEALAKLTEQVNSQISRLNGENVFKRIVAAIKNYREQVKLLGKDSQGAKEAQQGMFDAIAGAAADANSVIGALADSFQQLGIGGEGLQDVFKNVQGVISGAGSIAKGIASGNPVDIVTGSIGLLTSAISLFSHKDKDLQKKIDGYKKELDALGRSYADLDRQVQNSVGESVYSDQQSQIDNLIKQQAKLTQMRDAEVDKKKTDEDKVQEFQNQIDSIPGQIQDIQQAISQNLIQTTFKDLSNSLADAFTEAFSAGEDAAGRFDDVFEKVIANAIKNSLKLKILDPIVKKFTDDLTTYAKANNNSVIGFDFESYKKQLQQAGELFNAGLKGSEEFFQASDTASNITSSAKGIEAITTNQASAIDGLLRGSYDQQKQLVVLSTSGNILLSGIGKSMGDIYNVAIAIT
jgi:TP901 family phage tail tape measure protein